MMTKMYLIKYLTLATADSPEVKKVQSCHRFQNCKLVNQQS